MQPAILTGKDAKAGHRAPGYLIGEIVHRALAHWNCLSYPDQELLAFLEKVARRSGVQPQTLMHAVRTSFSMLGNLKRHPLYQTIQTAPQAYREVPFSLKTQERTLHGVIDLLYQDAQGSWHVLDWKTEWTPGGKGGRESPGALDADGGVCQGGGEAAGGDTGCGAVFPVSEGEAG